MQEAVASDEKEKSNESKNPSSKRRSWIREIIEGLFPSVKKEEPKQEKTRSQLLNERLSSIESLFRGLESPHNSYREDIADIFKNMKKESAKGYLPRLKELLNHENLDVRKTVRDIIEVIEKEEA